MNLGYLSLMTEGILEVLSRMRTQVPQYVMDEAVDIQIAVNRDFLRVINAIQSNLPNLLEFKDNLK